MYVHSTMQEDWLPLIPVMEDKAGKGWGGNTGAAFQALRNPLLPQSNLGWTEFLWVDPDMNLGCPSRALLLPAASSPHAQEKPPFLSLLNISRLTGHADPWLQGEGDIHPGALVSSTHITGRTSHPLLFKKLLAKRSKERSHYGQKNILHLDLSFKSRKFLPVSLKSSKVLRTSFAISSPICDTEVNLPLP